MATMMKEKREEKGDVCWKIGKARSNRYSLKIKLNIENDDMIWCNNFSEKNEMKSHPVSVGFVNTHCIVFTRSGGWPMYQLLSVALHVPENDVVCEP